MQKIISSFNEMGVIWKLLHITAMTGSVTTKYENVFLPSRVTRYDSHINLKQDKQISSKLFINLLLILPNYQ